MEENPNAGVVNKGSDNEIEYDEDGNPIAPPRKREIDPLPAIDHSEIEYKPFEKNFYTEHEDIANLSRSQVEELRNRLGVKVTGPVPPKPVTSFAHFGFDESLMKTIRKSEYTQHTLIQSQSQSQSRQYLPLSVDVTLLALPKPEVEKRQRFFGLCLYMLWISVSLALVMSRLH